MLYFHASYNVLPNDGERNISRIKCFVTVPAFFFFFNFYNTILK